MTSPENGIISETTESRKRASKPLPPMAEEITASIKRSCKHAASESTEFLKHGEPKLIASGKAHIDELQHSDNPKAIYAKAEPFINEEFTKQLAGLSGIIAGDKLYSNDHGAISRIADTIKAIKEGNYDTILPDNLGECEHGAALVYDDLTGDPMWAFADKETAGYLTDDNRRNYFIHILLPSFVNQVAKLMARNISPEAAANITAQDMHMLQTILDGVCQIAVHNSDPSIPFEDRLNGNVHLLTGILPAEAKTELRAMLFERQRINDDGEPVDEYGRPHTYGPWLPDDTCRHYHSCTDNSIADVAPHGGHPPTEA